MYETTKVHVLGQTALIMHSNYVLADPLHPITQRIKQITNNRKKSDNEILEAMRLEFVAGLYVEDGRVVVPGDNWNCMIREAGAKVPGITAKLAGANIYAETSELHYEGRDKAFESSADELTNYLWTSNEPQFRLVRPVKLQGGKSTVMRSRPIFNRWAAEVTVHYDTGSVPLEKVLEIFAIGGKIVGIGDWRPNRRGRYGTFVSLEASGNKTFDKAYRALAA